MKRIALIIIWFVFPLTFINAQGWELVYGETANNGNIGIDVIQTQDSAYVVAGAMDCDSNSICHAFVSKVSQVGDLLWTRMFYEDTSSVVVDVFEEENGDLVFIGTKNDTALIKTMFIAKISTTGEEVWSKVIDEIPGATQLQATRLFKLHSGNYRILGHTSNSTTFIGGTYMAEYDTDGNQIWENTYGFSNSSLIYDLTVDDIGVAFLVGYEYDVFANDYNYLMLKIDEDGNLINHNNWGEENYDEYFYNIIALDDGTFFAASRNENEDMVVLGLDDQGTILWETVYENYFGLFAKFEKTVDGNLIYEGSRLGEEYLLKIDVEGEFIWEKKIEPQVDVSSGFRMAEVYSTFDNGYIITGKIGLGPSSVYVIKLDAQGNLVNIIDLSQEMDYDIKVFPNPSSNYFIVEQEKFIEGLKLELFNAVGQQLLIVDLQDDHQFVNLNNISSGFYFYSISDGERNIKVGGIIIEN